MTTYTTTIGRYREHEFKASDGSRALIVLTVTTETDMGEYDYTIDPALAEVWPCVAAPFGYPAYAMESLTGDALQAWLTKHHEDLVSLAWDVASSDAERHDEERAER